jgi:aryl-alcohol dehydrogenase-like predicted oxidoreductase
MRYRTLGRTGSSVSVVGFGASPLGDVFGKTDRAERNRCVHYAVDQGINLFDVSPYYGKTLAEERLGEALDGRRDQVFLATKCGRYDTNCFDFSRGRIKRSIDESLIRLRTDRVDLLQAHDVEFGDARQIAEETIPALREIQQQGKARFIGITGYSLRMMTEIAEQAPVDTILSYCRYNLLSDDMDTQLTPFARTRGIGLINASPLHMGILTGNGAPEWHPAPDPVADVGAAVVKLCQERGVDPSQLALRFCLDHPYVAATLVGMSTVEQVEKNIRALTLEIDPELLVEIQRIAAPVKNAIWKSGRDENADGRQSMHQ